MRPSESLEPTTGSTPPTTALLELFRLQAQRRQRRQRRGHLHRWNEHDDRLGAIGQGPYYSTNNGSSWTASGGSPTTGGTVVADRVNPSDFYYYVGSKVYFSSNSGVSFTLETSSAPQRREDRRQSLRFRRSLDRRQRRCVSLHNDGASFAHVSSISTNGVIALGAAAPGQTTPAIYVFGTISGFLGIYRSDDGGGTWTLINSTSEQWGGMVQYMAADPNVFGRVYLAVNGRGIIMGNPASSLPSNWADADIYTPGNPAGRPAPPPSQRHCR